MKLGERKTNCPICDAEISADFVQHHISQMARRESISNLQKPKLHFYYKNKQSLIKKQYVFKQSNIDRELNQECGAQGTA